MGLVSKLFRGTIVLAVIAAIAFFFLQGVDKVSLEDFELTGLKEISADSFTLTGEFSIKNPSKTTLPVKEAEYDVILKETDEVISSGNLPTFNLEAEKINKVPFEQEVRWVPTAKLATELVTKEEVYVIVKGTLRINLPKIEEYEIPFEDQQNIKEYMRQFIEEKTPVENPLDEEENSNLPINDLI